MVQNLFACSLLPDSAVSMQDRPGECIPPCISNTQAWDMALGSGWALEPEESLRCRPFQKVSFLASEGARSTVGPVTTRSHLLLRGLVLSIQCSSPPLALAHLQHTYTPHHGPGCRLPRRLLSRGCTLSSTLPSWYLQNINLGKPA